MSERLFSDDCSSDTEGHWRSLILPLIPKGPVSCLEIGSNEGRSACWILDNIIKHDPGSHLDCVDRWHEMLEPERLFDHNLADQSQVTKHKDFSVHFLAPLAFENPAYDFIYIDGDRRGEILFTDISLSWRCLKKKGVMAINHYSYQGGDVAGVPSPKVALDTFLKMHADEIRLLELGRQVIVQKRAQPVPSKGEL